MAGEILLDEKKHDKNSQEGDGSNFFAKLEEKISLLLLKYYETNKAKEELEAALNDERKRAERLARRLEALSEDRDKVKSRIDQLLHRLKGVDL